MTSHPTTHPDQPDLPDQPTRTQRGAVSVANAPVGFIAPPAPLPAAWRLAARIGGPILAVGIAWACTAGSGDRSGLTMANVALIMALFTIGCAIVDSIAGVATSVAAALALNYFHTDPIHTLRITDRRDVYSVALLAGIGFAVSVVTELRVRSGVHRVERARAQSVGLQLRDRLHAEQPALDAWIDAVHGASGDLSLVVAQVVSSRPYGLPTIRRNRINGEDPMLDLPRSGAVVELFSPSTNSTNTNQGVGGDEHEAATVWLQLTPRSGSGPIEIDRRAIVAFAESIELVLAQSASPDTTTARPGSARRAGQSIQPTLAL